MFFAVGEEDNAEPHLVYVEELCYLKYIVILGAFLLRQLVSKNKENIDCIFVKAQGLHGSTLVVAHFDEAAVNIVQLGQVYSVRHFLFLITLHRQLTALLGVHLYQSD